MGSSPVVGGARARRVPRGHVPGRGEVVYLGPTGGSPRQLRLPESKRWRIFALLLELPFLLGGAVLIGCANLLPGIATEDRWGMSAGGVILIALSLGSAWFSRRAESRARRDLARLEARGLPGTAEITAIRPTTIGEESGIELTLRVSGPGLEPFEARSECREHESLVVGARLGVLVDPSDRLFAIV